MQQKTHNFLIFLIITATMNLGSRAPPASKLHLKTSPAMGPAFFGESA